MALAVLLGGAVAVVHWQRKRGADGPVLTAPPPLNLADVAEPDPVAIRAIEAARAEVRRAPRSADAWGRLGMMLVAHGALTADANVCFAQAERLNSRDPRWPYFRGNSLLTSDAESALIHLTRAAELCRERPDIARLKLAEALLARRQFSESETQFRRLLEVDPRHARALLGLARLAFLHGDLAAAEGRLTPALSDPHTRKRARNLLAEISYRKGDKAPAERLVAEARPWPDDLPWPDPFETAMAGMEVGRKKTLSAAMALMRKGRVTEAIRLLSEARGVYPGSERVLLLLGMAHHMARHWAEAEKVLREAVAKAPEAPRVQFHLGNALAAQERFEEASTCYDQAAQRMPDDADIHFRRGLCQTRLGDAARAEEAFRTALSCQPNFGEAHRRLGELIWKTGRRDEALAHLREAAALNPRDAEARRLLDNAEGGGAPESAP